MLTKFKITAAFITTIALLTTGTFAWQKAFEKTNEFTGNKNDVTVHDDFDPFSGMKDVYVENNGSVTVYVRIKLEETMNLKSYTWRPGANDWVTHTYEKSAADCGHTNTADHKLFHDFFKWTMGGWKYYMPGSDPQGIVQNTYKYNGTEPGVKKTPDAAIITSEKFLGMAETEQKAFIGWIYSTDGYAYWSQPLKTGDVTGLLLHGVESLKILENYDYYYAINVIVEVLDRRDIPMWTQGAPSVDGTGTTHKEASTDGKEVINIIVGNPVPPAEPPVETPDNDKELPVNKPEGGFTPVTVADPRFGDGYYAKINFREYGNPDPNYNMLYHTGSVHLEDVITDGNYSNVKAEAVDAKYAPYITVGECARHENKPSIIFSYEPTNDEFIQMQLGAGVNKSKIPVQVKLTRDDGKSAVVTINMIYVDSMITLDTSHM